MKKTTQFIISLFLAFNLIACGGSESESLKPEKIENKDTIILAQAILGSLSQSTVEIYEHGSNNLLYQGTTTQGDGKSVASAGLIKITPQEFDKIKNKMLIIKIHGGRDIDANDDNVWDDTPIENRGEIHAVVDSSTLDQNPFKINILTEVVYQDIKEKIKTLGKGQINLLLNEKAQKLLKDAKSGGDINQDGKIDNKDLLNWNPIIDKKNLQIDYEKKIKPLLSKIHNNEDIKDFSQELLKIKPTINVVKEDKPTEEEIKEKLIQEEEAREKEEETKKAEEEAQKKAEDEIQKKAEKEDLNQIEKEIPKEEEEPLKTDEAEDEYDFSNYLYPQQNGKEISMDRMENNSSIFKYKNIYFKNSDSTITQQPNYTLSQNIKYEIINDIIEVSFNKDNSIQHSLFLKKIIKINEDITTTSSNCILKSHQDTITHNQKNYEDILIIECRQNNTIDHAIYAKDIGIIIQNRSTINITGTSQKGAESIKIKSL